MTRIALVFPPSVLPLNPPLGLAQLLAHLRERGVEVRGFDLNLRYRELMLRRVLEGEIVLKLRNRLPPPVNEILLDRSAEVLKGEKGEEFFVARRYSQYAGFYRYAFDELDQTFVDIACRALYGESDPWVDTFLSELTEPVRAFKPEMVGFSLLFSKQILFALMLARGFKAEGLSIVAGGPAAFLVPEAFFGTLNVKGHSVEVGDLVDFVVVGEGEVPMAALAEGSKGPSEIPGLAYRRDRLHENEGRVVEDLNALPVPDYGDFDLPAYYSPSPVLPLAASRGCYWRRCSFCVHHKSYLSYRTKSAERVVEEMEDLQKWHGGKHFSFVDEMIHPKQFEKLSEALITADLGARFYALAKPTKAFNRPLLRKMHRAGVRALLWGVESGSQRLLDLMEKGTKVEEMEGVLRAASEAGIWNMAFILFGFPTETEEEFLETLAFLKRNRSHIDVLGQSVFTLELDSPVYQAPERFRIREIRRSNNPFSTACDFQAEKGLSPREAFQLQKRYEKDLNSLYRVSREFGVYRDHMLLYADRLGRPEE
jgi:hypothetical protein